MIKKRVITPSAKLAVSIADFEVYEGISHGKQPDLISQLIKAAIETIEERGVQLINQTIRLTWDDVPEERIITLDGLYPVSSIDSIYSVDDDDTANEYDSSYYALDEGYPTRVLLKSGNSWPTNVRQYACFYINAVCGFGAEPSDVPQNLRFAIMQTASDWYENRNRFRARTLSDSVLNIVNAFSCPVN